MDKWDLTPLYPSFDSDEFRSDLDTLKADISAMEKIIAEDNSPSDKAEKYILAQNTFLDRAERLIEYAALRASTDTADTEANKYLDIIENTLTQTAETETKFIKWLLTAGKMDDRPVLKEHAFYLDELSKEGKHILSPGEESVFAKMRVTGSSAFNKLWETKSADLTAEVNLPDGVKTLPIAEVRNLAYDPSEKVRKASYEAELKALDTIKDDSAFALNSIKGEVITEATLRRYKSPLDMTLAQSRMDENVLYPMLEAMKEAMPDFRRYFRHKAALLGHKGALPFYDLFAPVGESSMSFTLEQAKDTVCESFASFSPVLSDYAKNAFEGGWIDIFPRKGKRGGAFCSNLHCIKQSRFLTNFTGSLNDVITFAHELGHGYHGHMLNNETAINSHYPMPIAETASTFCETITKNALLDKADNKTKLFILETDISDSAQIVVDIFSRFLFEDKLFKLRKDGPLTAEEMSDIMLWAQKETYGDGLDENYLHKYMWVIKPHYYDAEYNYYNFPYAFGLLFARGLYSIYKQRGASFAADYDRLLSVTGKNLLKDAAALFDIDITSKDFWIESVKEIKSDIDKFINISSKK